MSWDPERWRHGWSVFSLVLMLGATSCGTQPGSGNRVLLVGIDGATLRVAEPMIAEGRLPNLARLAAEGVSGPLRSFPPLHSPRIWTTIATGKTADKHGIETFVRRDAKGKVRLYASHDRRTHALWNILSEVGQTVAVVNWWVTYPPEIVKGVVVSDHFLADEVAIRRKIFQARTDDSAPVVFPMSWRRRIGDLVAIEAPLTSRSNPFTEADAFAPWIDVEMLSQRFHHDAGITRIALAIEKEIRPDLLMVFLPGIDRASHQLWGMLEDEELYPPPLRPTPEQREVGAGALRRYYEHTDGLIGLLMERFTAEDLVVVVSDHGFEAGVLLETLTGRHETQGAASGVVFARGPGIRRGSPAGPITVNDITPTILTWLGLPVGRDMDGRPAAFLEASAPSPIETYDTQPIRRLEHGSEATEQKILEELRSLGYIE